MLKTLEYLRNVVSAQLDIGGCSTISHVWNNMEVTDRVDTFFFLHIVQSHVFAIVFVNVRSSTALMYSVIAYHVQHRSRMQLL